MRITVQVSTELVQQGLENLFSAVPKVGRRRVRTVMERIKRRMQEYPQERPGQSIKAKHSILGTVFRRAPRRYKRTGNFGSHWMIGENREKTGYFIANTAQRKGKSYGRYVVGGADGTGQAWMHRGRWTPLRDATDEEVAKLPMQVRDDIKLIARKEGFTA